MPSPDLVYGRTFQLIFLGSKFFKCPDGQRETFSCRDLIFQYQFEEFRGFCHIPEIRLSTGIQVMGTGNHCKH